MSTIEVGAEELVLVDLLERVIVIERGSSSRAALPAPPGSSAKRPAATAAPSTTAMTPSTVTRERIAGQLKALTSGFGKARPEVSMTMCSGGLARVQQLLERRDEIVGDGAADAAIGELDDVVLAAGLDAAGFEDLAVDADVAELVDDEGEAAAVGVLQEVADQRRLAGAEKAGDDGAGNLGHVRGKRHVGRLNGLHVVSIFAVWKLRGARARSRLCGTAAVARARARCRSPRRRKSARLPRRLPAGPRVEIADEVGPLVGRGEREGARPLANGEAIDGPDRDRVFVCERTADAIGQR